MDIVLCFAMYFLGPKISVSTIFKSVKLSLSLTKFIKSISIIFILK